MRFTVTIEPPGRVIFGHRGLWEQWLSQIAGKLDKQGAPVRWLLELERWRKPRSVNQNAAYWVIVEPMCREYLSNGRMLPLSKEQCHSLLKQVFLVPFLTVRELELLGCEPLSVRMPGGVEVQPEVSSADLTTVQWEAWMSRIREHALLVWGFRIPEPNEGREDAYA